MNVIEIQGLTKRYGARRGIDGLNLSVPPGALFGFLGPNGAGKTTTIRLLVGLMRASEGRAEVLGKDVWRESHVIKRDLGYVSGDLRLYSWMNVREGLRIVGETRGRDLTRAGMQLAERFALDPEVRVRKMSRGMRQKLGLLLAMAHEPRVLVLDEPTSALDPLMQQTLYAELRERAARGVTVFFSSHTLSEVEALCDRVAIVRAGQLVADETLDGLRSRARRIVTLRWNSHDASAAAQVPPMLTVDQRNGASWSGWLHGDVLEFVRWSANQPLDDVTISPPDLDRLFQSYYTREDSGRE